MSERILVAFSGPQGSGKTTLATEAHSVLSEAGLEVHRFGIKATFQPLVSAVQHALPTVATGETLARLWTQKAQKNLQLALSTWAEAQDPDIWSLAYERGVLDNPGAVVTDDIRTPANLQALIRLANDKVNVVLILLMAPADIRKSRVSVWRENGLANTEDGLGPIPPGTWLKVHFLSTHFSGLSEEDSLKRSKEDLRGILNRTLSLGL